MGHRIPGPQGVSSSQSEIIDSGTLARTATPAPGIEAGNTSAQQQGSWTRLLADLPRSADEMTAKLGEIYFRTDDDTLDSRDAQVLQELCANLRLRLGEGYRLDLLCTGHADHRASESYNLGLGRRRAESVRQYIACAVSDDRLRVDAVSEGESAAMQPGPGSKSVPHSSMAHDRRVDIVVGNATPPARIAMEGNWLHTSGLEELELNHGGSVYASTSERVTVMIRTNYQLMHTARGRQALVECRVIRLDTGALLFTASAALDADRIIMRKGYKTRPDSRVTRVIMPGSTPPPGATIVDVRDRASTDQARDLLSTVFDQLRGKHRNITERVEAALLPNATAQ